MPDDWPRVPLGEVLTHDQRYIDAPEAKMYPKVSVKLYGRGVTLDPPADGSLLKMKRHQLARAGQVILSEIWGKKGAIGIVPPEGDVALCTSHFFLFDINPGRIDPGYLGYIFLANYLQDQLGSEAFGTTGYAAVRPRHLLKATIPLPPVGEQRRVVARVDAVAARVADARRLRDVADADLAALTNSLLDSVLPAEVDPTPLGELLEPGRSISYGVLVPGPDVADGVPFVRVQDLSVDRPPATPSKRIAADIDAQYTRTRLSGGEVLVGVVGTIGKIGIAPESWKGANIARAVCRIQPGPMLDRRYLAAVLLSRRSQDYFAATTRTLAQPTLNVGQLELTPIPVPPLDEQRRIVAHLDAVRAKADELRRLQAESAAELDALLPAVLARAFAGEL